MMTIATMTTHSRHGYDYLCSTYIHIYIYTYMNSDICIYMYIRACMYAYMHKISLAIYLPAYLPTYLSTQSSTYKCNIHIYIHIYMYNICTHACLYVCFCYTHIYAYTYIHMHRYAHMFGLLCFRIRNRIFDFGWLLRVVVLGRSKALGQDSPQSKDTIQHLIYGGAGPKRLESPVKVWLLEPGPEILATCLLSLSVPP